MATDWAYMQYGMYSITTELWNRNKDIPGMPEFSGEDARLQLQRYLLQYQDDHNDGDLFIDWKRYRHPELGEGEIGGWKSQYSGSNAYPGAPLEHVCDMHYRFELFRAGLLPEVVIADAEAKVLYRTDNASAARAEVSGDRVTITRGNSKGKYAIVEVTAKIENAGQLATHVARGAQLAGNRQDAVWLIGDRDKMTFLQGSAVQRLGVLEGTREIPGYAGGESGRQRTARTMRNAPPDMMQMMQRGQRGQMRRERAESGSEREVTWLIALEGDSPLKIVVTSQKGGTKVKNLTIKD
jgi:hypothetical protein